MQKSIVIFTVLSTLLFVPGIVAPGKSPFENSEDEPNPFYRKENPVREPVNNEFTEYVDGFQQKLRNEPKFGAKYADNLKKFDDMVKSNSQKGDEEMLRSEFDATYDGFARMDSSPPEFSGIKGKLSEEEINELKKPITIKKAAKKVEFDEDVDKKPSKFDEEESSTLERSRSEDLHERPSKFRKFMKGVGYAALAGAGATAIGLSAAALAKANENENRVKQISAADPSPSEGSAPAEIPAPVILGNNSTNSSTPRAPSTPPPPPPPPSTPVPAPAPSVARPPANPQPQAANSVRPPAPVAAPVNQQPQQQQQRPAVAPANVQQPQQQQQRPAVAPVNVQQPQQQQQRPQTAPLNVQQQQPPTAQGASLNVRPAVPAPAPAQNVRR